MKLDRLLSRITSLIVRTCDPEKVILFGSYAKVQEDANSDLDILVVCSFRGSSFLLSQELRQLLHDCPIHIDFQIATPYEVEEASMKPLGFLSSVLLDGIVLYTKSGETEKPKEGVFQLGGEFAPRQKIAP